MTKATPLSFSPEEPISGLPLAKYGYGGRVRIEAILRTDSDFVGQDVTVCGWSKTVRKQGSGLVFVALSDGSCCQTLQIVVSKKGLSEEAFQSVLKCGVACSMRVRGRIVKSPASEQAYEMQVDTLEEHSVRIYGYADQAKYPLAKKSHSKEFLRENLHLRPRTNYSGCITRIRTALARATHEFFQSRGCEWIHTPIITGADCEGAGEMFQVTTVVPPTGEVSEIPVTDKKIIDYRKDFFGKKVFLTVSGQLTVEPYCCSLSDVYTFGPCFRAEVSHTSRHLSEFWMIEAEIAFAELEECMDCAESYLRFCVKYILDCHREDVAWCDANIEEGLIARLETVVNNPFARMSYTEVIEELGKLPRDTFERAVEWGMDLGSEHERYLCEKIHKKPVIVYNYPKDIKAFYMKVNEDGKTVRAMDVLLPRIGEVIGGSQREEILEVLDKQIRDKQLDPEQYEAYRDLRRYGTVPHSGFGLGFERLMMLVTGAENIKDVIPFPRSAGTAAF